MEKKKPHVLLTDKMVLAGFGFAVVYWLIETFIFVIFSIEINFSQRLFGPDLTGVCTRVIALCLFIIFGAHAQFTINERNQAMDELKLYREKTETLIAERTGELKRSNEQLREEVEKLKALKA